MNWTVYGIECVVLVAVFTCAIMIPLCRNPVWWIHDYPKDIQEKEQLRILHKWEERHLLWPVN